MQARYKHIIWDWNGTLLNDTGLCVCVLNGLLAKRSRAPISKDAYRMHFGFPVVHFYEYLGFDTDQDSFEAVSREFINDYESRWLKECALHQQATEILSKFNDCGVSHSILSAAEQSALEKGVQHFGIDGFFIGQIGTEDIYARGKIEQGRKWIKRLPWKPSEVLLIGDTEHDYEVAQAIGTDCLLMAHGHHSPERLQKTGAPVMASFDRLFQSLVESEQPGDQIPDSTSRPPQRFNSDSVIS